MLRLENSRPALDRFRRRSRSQGEERKMAFSGLCFPTARDARQCAEANAQRGYTNPKIVG